MKAAQINKYSKDINIIVRDIPIPEISDDEVLVKVKAAAVNPLEILILTGSVRLIQDYKMPLTLGNEFSGVVEKIGKNVKDFKIGDKVYTRMPIEKIGAFADYAAVDSKFLSLMPNNCDFSSAAAIPLTALTAYQAFKEELEAKSGETVLITGGSGSFGEMAVPIAKYLGLNVIVSGNDRVKEHFVSLGTDKYIDYRKENYWEAVSNVDYVIDTLGAKEFDKELSVLKKGGRILSLRTSPNKKFAEDNKFPFLKRVLFSFAGSKYDKKAMKEGKEYRFMFVRADGEQLKEITKIVEKKNIKPKIFTKVFSIDNTEEAIKTISKGGIEGKIIISI
ncbi:NADP-dependent oxidoreductase [Brachyspira hampsonii]|uniref:Quinone oxidoreductase n=2 Tax=Brachyspira hampsonii TaxID=1287055 RepID=A0AAC9TPP9_9SPIR|nr:NADP-dependent oxidoreductase [Brachyspira hampsonii]ASJ20360.1 quinone oxidoreductase [Brachyspira hampsonii]ELV06272.1 molecular chaperone GroES [Brachyspira hampsonii 30599]OEJ16315.1 oxidoreductase [Brachyspira hampsonii]